MYGYFKPLRRKIGLLTLVVACLFAGAWVRSQISEEAFSWPLGGHRKYIIEFNRDWILWCKWSTLDEKGLMSVWPLEQFYLPYWVVVMPLAVLSSILLFIKPSPTKLMDTASANPIRFFQGWRRTTGIVAIVLASVSLAGWIRSFYIQDVLACRNGLSTIAFRSFEGSLGAEHFSSATSLSRTMVTGWLSQYRSKSSSFDPWWRFDNFDDDELDWRWKWAGFDFGVASKKQPSLLRRSLALWIIPYWCVVLPLTLLSAWLLLSKPRAPKPAPPIAEKA